MARPKRSSKKTRLTYVQGACDSADLISNLPESVLSHILSYLPTKQAVRTCVLSKDWKEKWTCAHSIHVNDNDYGINVKDKSDKFSYFMGVLTHLRWKSKSSFKGVHLTCCWKYSSFNLSLWVSSLLGKTTHTFELKTRPYYPYTLSNCLRNLTSLMECTIHSPCNLKVPGVLLFNNLKKLNLGGRIEIENEESDTDKLLLSFPVLEFLELENCEWLNVKSVEISAPVLTRFVSRSTDHLPGQYVIRISAEKLREIDSYGSNIVYFVLCAPSVHYASLDDLNFWRASIGGDLYVSRACLLLEGFPDLKYLRISNAVVQNPSKYPFPSFKGLKQLYFICHDVRGGEAIFRLLKALPSIEFLGIEMWYSSKAPYDDDTVLKLSPECIVSPLKDVALRRFIGSPKHIQLAKSILTYVKHLETMTINLGYQPHTPGIDIEQQLSSSAKGLTRASIVVNSIWKKRACKGSPDWIVW